MPSKFYTTTIGLNAEVLSKVTALWKCTGYFMCWCFW